MNPWKILCIAYPSGETIGSWVCTKPPSPPDDPHGRWEWDEAHNPIEAIKRAVAGLTANNVYR